MAQGIDAMIAAALLDHLSDIVTNPVMPIAMPGVEFPKKGQAKPSRYLAAFFIPNATRTVTLANGTQQHVGLLQVSVFWEAGAGIIKPLDLAGQVIEHFSKDTSLLAGDIKIRVDREPWAAGPIQEPNGISIPVTISYHAFA